jgi:integrase
MGRAYEMSWEGSPAYRWVKMYKGTRYRVSCEELRAPLFTAEGSYKLANDWWRNKLAELNKPSPEEEITNRYKLADLEEQIDQAQKTLQSARMMKAALQGQAVDFVPISDYHRPPTIPLSNLSDESRLEYLSAASEGLGTDPVPTDKTLKTNAEKFLAVIQGEMRPLSFREIRLFLRSLYDQAPMLHADTDVSDIQEAKVEEVYLWLKNLNLEQPTRKKRWGFFKRFVVHLWEKRLISERPRNLDTLKFKITSKAVKRYDVEKVRTVLAGLKPRLRLYALLGLNCGMTAADIGRLKKDQVNLDGARLVRKRGKTLDNPNVPEVDYPLWPETIALLRECWSEHDTLALTSEDGTALWESRQEDDKTPQKDLVYQQWKRAKQSIPHHAFRSISTTLLEDSEFATTTLHFLGHSPRSIKDKHYAAPPQKVFNKAILWLRDEVLGSQTTQPSPRTARTHPDAS